jgi:cell division protein FtsB
MPDHDTPVPPHASRRITAPAGSDGRTDDHADIDLAALPTFLRDRDCDRDRSRGTARPIRRHNVPPGVDPGAGGVTAAAVAALPMAGLPPRRLAALGAAIVLVWMIGSFGRQVTEASAATARADQLRAATDALAIEVAGLEQELQTVQDGRYIDGAARAYRLGTSREIAFALEVGAPPLGPDAPGSGAHRLGAEASSGSPLESWLSVLFGPDG